MLPEMTWPSVLKYLGRNPGGELEMRFGDLWLRGPIESLIGPKAMPMFTLKWLARQVPGSTFWSPWLFGGTRTFGASEWSIMCVTDTRIEFISRISDQYWGVIHTTRGNRIGQLDAPGLVWPVEDRSWWRFPRVEMTDEEWVALIGTGNAADYDDPEAFPALPPCCGNIGCLRDVIANIHSLDGYAWPGDVAEAAESYHLVVDGHDGQDWTILDKFMGQIVPGITSAVPEPAA